ncbi:META domain-containing protein [Hymenobacter busanensis]
MLQRMSRFASLIASVLFTAMCCGGCRSTDSTTQASATTPTNARPPAPLDNTRWVLTKLGQQPVRTPDGSREQYLLLRQSESRVEGFAGCNTIFGQYQTPTTGELVFANMGATRMACPRLPEETRFLAALTATRSYRVVADTLRLYDAATTDQPVATFHAVYLR